jgi:galactokinase
LADSAYNRRRNECAEVVLIAQQNLPGVKSLRDLRLKDLEAVKPFLEQVVYRRGEYVIEENNRVLEASEALQANDLKKFGQLMYASHDGLSKKYDVSCAELDFLVDFTKPLDYVLGSRMMGGGFGGCTINLVKTSQTETLQTRIAETYSQKFGTSPKFYAVKAENGTGLLNP